MGSYFRIFLLFLIPSYAFSQLTYTKNIFTVIGDYGDGSNGELKVADLVKSWNPEFIITLGDNNYPEGDYSTIDASIGKYYHDYIHPYNGTYGAGADTNRFFPCIGNHDDSTDFGQPYIDYFILPGNERYYDFAKGDVHWSHSLVETMHFSLRLSVAKQVCDIRV